MSKQALTIQFILSKNNIEQLLLGWGFAPSREMGSKSGFFLVKSGNPSWYVEII